MEHYDWNDGWLFCPTFDPALVRPECTGLELESVRIPHTVKALPYNYCNENDHQRLCGYRREFFAPAEWAGRTVLLTFGAIAHDATVFCNGRRLFHHGCGYTAFTVDLTSALHLGKKNVVAVRCDSREDLNIPPFGGSIDYLTYGGIYRAVSLDIKEPAYLRDVFVEARAEGDFRIYTATVGETVGCTLQAEIRSPAGSRAVYRGELALPITGTLNGVHPWSIEHPTLYTLTVKLIRPGTSGLPDRVLDEKTVRFGFRTVQFVAGGLYLNGQRVVLRGINRHQSYAYQGYAMPDSLQRLDAQFIKKGPGLQCRAHQPLSPEPGLPGCLRRAGPAGVHRDARLAAHRRRSLEGAGPAEPAGRWCASAATIPVCFCGVHGSTAAPMMKPFTSAPTRPSIGWTPPAPRRVPISAAASSCWRMCTPTTIIPTGAEAPPVRPAPPSPRTPARATSSASSAGRTSRQAL